MIGVLALQGDFEAHLKMLRDLGAVHVVCGADYRFGFRGAGTAQLLQETCARHGVGYDPSLVSGGFSP